MTEKMTDPKEALIAKAYRSSEEDASYYASIWGLSSARMQELERAFREHERNAPPRTAVEGVRRLIQPGITLSTSEVRVDGFDRKAVFNALTYLTRTGELAHAGYGKYQAPPADLEMRPETTAEHIARDIADGRFPERSEPQDRPVPDALAALSTVVGYTSPDDIQRLANLPREGGRVNVVVVREPNGFATVPLYARATGAEA